MLIIILKLENVYFIKSMKYDTFKYKRRSGRKSSSNLSRLIYRNIYQISDSEFEISKANHNNYILIGFLLYNG